jgi:hypothetical protein
MAWVKTESTGRDFPGKAVLMKEEAVGNVKTLAISAELGAKHELHIDSIRIDYTADATVGTRTLRVEVKEGAVVLLTRDLNVATNLTAGQNEQTTLLLDQRTYEAVGAEHFDFLPPGKAGVPLKLFGGQSLVISDFAGIAATDTCKVYVRGSRY